VYVVRFDFEKGIPYTIQSEQFLQKSIQIDPINLCFFGFYFFRSVGCFNLDQFGCDHPYFEYDFPK